MANNNKHTGPNVPALRFPEFSGEWKQCQIKDFGKVITGSTPPTSKTEFYDNGVFLWASPADLGNVKDVISTKTKLSQQGFDKCRKIPAHSILVTCIGSTIGKMGMATTEMATNQQINSIIPIDCSPDYVYYSIQSRFPKYITSIATQAVPILSKSVFESLDSYKTSIEEQNKIGKLLHLLDERIDAQSKIIEEQETLLKSLADKLISAQGANVAICGCVDAKASTMKEGELESHGAFPVFGASGLCGYSNEALEESDSILVTKDGSGVGTCQYATGAHSFLGTLCSLTAKEGVYLPYVYYALLNFNFASFKTGLAIPHIYFKDYGKAIIYCPFYDEQVRIASGFEKIEAKIKSDTELLKQYELQKEYLLSRMFI